MGLRTGGGGDRVLRMSFLYRRTVAGLKAWVFAALVVSVATAQVGPPSCPVTGNKPAGVRPADTRTTVESTRATAEAAAADPSVIISAEPMENFGVARYRLSEYADCVGTSGCYWSDLEAQTRRASAELDRLVATHKGEKLAMVLDIDETSLSSYCEMSREDYGYISGMNNEWIAAANAPVIPGTLRLFDQAKAEGVDVFFITGRVDEQRAATVKNLEAAGYKGWKGLSLRVGTQKSMATVEYKSEERRRIVARGYRIVLSVGDQWSDLNGDPRAEVSVKLPNPFYYLP